MQSLNFNLLRANGTELNETEKEIFNSLRICDISGMRDNKKQVVHTVTFDGDRYDWFIVCTTLQDNFMTVDLLSHRPNFKVMDKYMVDEDYHGEYLDSDECLIPVDGEYVFEFSK